MVHDYITEYHDLKYPNLVIIQAIGDGSCFIHAILRSFNKSYIEGSNHKRSKICRKVRDSLASTLGEINPENNKTYYDSLGNGTFGSMSIDLPEISLSHMQKELRGSNHIGYSYLEYFSNIFDLDIYIINGKTKKLYNLGESNLDTYYRNRNSIVILWRRNHYDLLGIRQPSNTIDCYFTPSHPLIKYLFSHL